jgi:hypothetical protein
MAKRLAEPTVSAADRRLDEARAVAVAALRERQPRVTCVEAERRDGIGLSGGRVPGMPADRLAHESAQRVF